jgi:4-diphosphocytidyl-2-C-methyl-D-erythritol kinase
MISSFAPAKVNLYLHVTGKRADGYHLLDSLAVFPNVGDILSYAPADTLSLDVTGEFAEGLAAEPDNLVLRSARLLAERSGGSASGRLLLQKNLPVASGIGGGSADAAAALRLLQSAWRRDVKLQEVALALGADVPVCLGRRAARMGGIGEILYPAPKLPGFGMVLVNPGCAVATADVFRARPPTFSPPARLPEAWPEAAAMAAALARLDNDLEATAVALAPAIAGVLESLRALPGALLARMSGSGATCFALLETAAAAAASAVQLQRPGWWCWGGGLYESGVTDL